MILSIVKKTTFVCVLCVSLLYFLCATTQGLKTLVEVSSFFLPGKLEITNIDGRLISNIKIQKLSYQSTHCNVTLDFLNIRLIPKKLLDKKIFIQNFEIKGLHVALTQEKNARTPHGTKKWNIKSFALLKIFMIHHMQIEDLVIVQDTNNTLKINGFYLNYSEPNQYKISFQGKLDSYLLRSKMGFFYDNEQIKIQPSTIKIGEATLQFSGLVGKIWDMNWDIQIPNLSTILPTAKGKLMSRGKMVGFEDKINVQGQLNAEKFSLPDLNIDMVDFKTKLMGDIKLSNTRKNSIIKIEGALKQGELYIPKLKISLNKIEFNAHYQSQQGVSFEGTCKAGRGIGKVVGTWIKDTSGDSLSIKVIGKDMLALDLPEYRIVVSPDLLIHYNDENTTLSGNLFIPYARIQPKDFSEITTLPDEAIIVSRLKKQVDNKINHLSMKIHLVLGKDIFISYANLKTKLTGDLILSEKLEGPLIASGELSAINGQYKAYGRLLKINQGGLIYAGNSLSNPGLNIKASKKIETISFAEDQSQFAKDHQLQSIYQGTSKIKVGVLVRGTLDQPKVSFFSDPPGLNQNDILSYLVFGYPRSKIKDMGNLAILNNIASTVNSGDSHLEKIGNKVQKIFGLTNLSIGTVESFDPKNNETKMNTAVSISKKFGKKFSIKYRMGVSNSSSVLSLKYQINKLFALQSSTSNLDSGADLLFEYEHD